MKLYLDFRRITRYEESRQQERLGTDILTADASLYIVGDWRSNDGKNTIERECLLESGTVMACLGEAVEDDRENNS